MTKATPLHLAARSGNRDVVIVLIQARAPVDAQDVFGRTPLANAIYFGKEHAGRALIEGGASLLNVKADLPIPMWAGGEAGRVIASKVFVCGFALTERGAHDSCPLLCLAGHDDRRAQGAGECPWIWRGGSEPGDRAAAS
jgi:ankyrin repeat protein